jgi:DNA-binding protein HU-beta
MNCVAGKILIPILFMKKQDLVEVVMNAGGIEVKKQAAAVVDAIFETIAKTMAKGEEVAIAGFGTFKVAKRAAREGINPRTGEKIQIAASTKPKFRAAKALKEAVQ